MRARSFSIVGCIVVVAAVAGCSSGGAGAGKGGSGGGGSGGGGGGGTAGAATTGSAGVTGAAGATSGSGGSNAGGTSGVAGSIAGTTGSGGNAGSSAGTTGSGGIAGSVAGTTGTGGAAGASAGTTGTGGAGGNCLAGDINVRATTVSGTLTVNGAALTDASKGQGTASLINASDGATIAITSAPGGTFSTVVAPGTYDLVYSQVMEGTGVPINTAAKLRSGIVVGASPLALNVDVPATTLSGSVSINGLTGMPSSKGEGSLWLRNASGDNALLTTTSPTSGSYTAMVVPGTYDVYYSLNMPGTAAPKNSSAKVASGLVVGTTPPPLTINILATTVFGTVTIKGAAVTGNNKGTSALALRNAAGDSATLTPDSFTTGSYSAQIVPGTYDLYYAGAGTAFPSNASAKLQSGIVVGSSSLSLNVDVPATTVSGAVTINGAVPSGLNASTGLLTLRNAAGDSVPLSVSSTGAHSTLVVPGTYDLYFNPAVVPAGAPANHAARLESGIVVGTSALALDVDIPATAVSGMITVNGAAISDYNQGQGVINLVNAAGDSVRLGTTTAGAYSVLVVPGTYDVQYTLSHIGPALPYNTAATIKKGVVVGSAPLSLNVDVPTATVAGMATVNGAALTASPTSSSPAFFLNLVGAAGDSAGLAVISSATGYSSLIIPGSYELTYKVYRPGAPVPSNSNTDLGCFTVR